MATQAFGPGIRALSIYDTTDGTVIQIDGADISPESTITRTSVTRTSAKGGVSALNKQWELEVRFADDSAFSSLDAEDSQTRKWQVVAAGLNGRNLQWYEDSTFVLEQSVSTDPTSDSNFPYILRMSHISETPAIYQRVNLLAYKGWEDADSDGLMDGYLAYRPSDQTSTVISSVEQRASRNGGPYGIVIDTIIFPIEGITLTLSNTVWQDTSTASTKISVIRASDFSGTELVANTTALTGLSETTVQQKSITTPANTYRIPGELFRVESVPATLESTNTKYPALTTNGVIATSSEFLSY